MPVRKLTPELTDLIVDAVRSGLPFSLASAKAGVTRRALQKWLAAGRAYLEDPETGDEFYADLAERVDQARATFAEHQVARIDNAGGSDWKAAAWLLKTQYPEFSEKQIIEMSGRDGGPIETNSKVTTTVDQAWADEVRRKMFGVELPKPKPPPDPALQVFRDYDARERARLKAERAGDEGE